MDNHRLSNNSLLQHILKHAGLNAQERIIAVLIACHRNERTLKCCPTMEQLSQFSGIPERWRVSRIVDELRKKGVLGTIKLPNMERPTRSPNQYYFMLDLEAATGIASCHDFEGDKDSFDCYCMKLANKPF